MNNLLNNGKLMHNKIKLLNKAFSLTGNSYASSCLSNLYKISEYNSDEEELLDILINDDTHRLTEEESANFENWDFLKEFLQRNGADISEITKPSDGSVYFFVKIPGKGAYVLDESLSFSGSEVTEWVQDVINSGRADEWCTPDDVYPPDVLYHGTSEENTEDILTDGIGCRAESRGFSNRSVGCAIFTSSNEEEAYQYGEAIFRIDFGKMRADGETPEVGMEPDIEAYEMASSLASRFGLSLGEDVYYDIEYGMSYDTFIIYGHIDKKYITLI
jgi:hypothetical protein